MKKRILPLLLTLALCISLSVPALAVETVTVTTTGTIMDMPYEYQYKITGVLSREETTWETRTLRAHKGEAQETGTAKVEGTIYTVASDYEVTDAKNGGAISYGTGYRLAADGKFETVGFIEYSSDHYEYIALDFTQESAVKARQKVTREEFLAKCDLINMAQISDTGVWVRVERGDTGGTTPAVPDAPATPTTMSTVCAATLDGKAVSLNAYLFSEANYVMLRDVATLLSGSKAQFEVSWDKEKGIVITTGQAYTAVGGELQSKGEGAKPYTVNQSAITVNG